MSPKNTFWSKIFSPSSAQASADAQNRETAVLKGLLDGLAEAPAANAPGDALNRVVSALEARGGWLYTLDGSGPGLSMKAQAGSSEAANPALHSLRVAIADKAVADGQMGLSPGGQPDSMLGVPLNHQGEKLGAAVFSFTGNIPLVEMTSFYTDLGHYLGAVLFHARLGEQAWQEAAQRRQLETRLEKVCADGCQQGQELELLNQVIAAILTGADAPAILEKLCHELVATFGVKQSAAALLDEAGQVLHIVAEFVPPGGMPCVGMDIPVTNNPSSLYVIRMKAPLAVSDVQHDILMIPVYELMKQRGVASMLILPLLVGDRVIGTVGVDSAEPHEYHEDEIALALKATSLAAWAVAQLESKKG